MEKIYESAAVLYYPAVISEQVEHVSARELMDDAIAVMSQEMMLAKVEQDIGISWKRIREGFSINGNQETGIINISVRLDDSQLAYECTESIIRVFCEELEDWNDDLFIAKIKKEIM